MRKLIYPIILPLSVALTACTTVMENIPGVYTLDIQQGNVINQDMIDQLKPGMTKRQVLYVMGSSMLVDVFHQKRWDYLYSEQLGGELRKQKKVSLFFNDKKLVAIQGDFRPSIVPVGKKSNESTVEVPPRELDKTLAEKISSLFEDEPPVKNKAVKKARAVKKVKPSESIDQIKKEDNSLWGNMTSVFSDDDAEEETEKFEKIDSLEEVSTQEENGSVWDSMTSVFSSDDTEEDVVKETKEIIDLNEVSTQEESSSVWDSMTSVFSSDDTEEDVVKETKEITDLNEVSTQEESGSVWDSMTSVFSSDDTEEDVVKETKEITDLNEVSTQEESGSVWDSMTSVFSSDDTTEDTVLNEVSTQEGNSSTQESMAPIFSGDNSEK